MRQGRGSGRDILCLKTRRDPPTGTHRAVGTVENTLLSIVSRQLRGEVTRRHAERGPVRSGSTPTRHRREAPEPARSRLRRRRCCCSARTRQVGYPGLGALAAALTDEPAKALPDVAFLPGQRLRVRAVIQGSGRRRGADAASTTAVSAPGFRQHRSAAELAFLFAGAQHIGGWLTLGGVRRRLRPVRPPFRAARLGVDHEGQCSTARSLRPDLAHALFYVGIRWHS